jgi:predicted acylesterase/phospholipase RssA
MLTPQPATAPKRRSSLRFGVALAGGGPLGAFYELGALHAISEGIAGLDLTDCATYVGVSSGSLVAAGLANGLSTVEMGRMLITNEAIEFPMPPGMLLRPAFAEYASRLLDAPGTLLRALLQYARDPLNQTLASTVSSLGRSVPTGIFDNIPLEHFLSELFSSGGRTNDFRRLRKQLYIVATDLNSGESVRFGEPGFDHVPISRAVQASTALPGLYPPVKIGRHFYVDGALIRTMNASVALEQGADLVICINPLVTFDASHGARRRLSHNLVTGGLPVVLSQTFRALIQSRMYVGMASYRGRYPEADLLLFEPDRNDERMFFVNVFRYADRQALVDHAYQRTRRDLLRHADELEPLLARHGLGLDRNLLEDSHRHFGTAIEQERRQRREVFERLDRTLDQLRDALRAAI